MKDSGGNRRGGTFRHILHPPTANISSQKTYCGSSPTRLPIPYQSRHEIRISEKATSISDAFTRYDWDVWIFLHVILPHDLKWFSGGTHCLSRRTIIRKRLDWVQFLQNDGWIVSIGKILTPVVEIRWRSTNIKEFGVRRFVALATECG